MKLSLKCIHALALILLASTLRAQAPEMTAHFINVGQANATLLQFPCGTMLIDCGAEDAKYADRLIAYLDRTLVANADGHKVIDILFITHTHKDHNSVLKRVAERFEIKRYIDNGDISGSGKAAAAAIRKSINDGSIDANLTEIRQTRITGKHGHTSKAVDPFKCPLCDPKIKIMSASRDEAPDSWSSEDFDNENNHSLVIRVDFGESSFLFPGDLEEAGIESLLDSYQSNPADLDVDVWEVNHHGASNGASPDLVTTLSPAIAIISCGNMEYGKATTNRWDAWNYGHPRADTISLLHAPDGVQTTRPSVQVNVGDKSKKFHKRNVSKAIYATAWDGTIIVKGFLNKDPEVVQTLREPSPQPN